MAKWLHDNHSLPNTKFAWESPHFSRTPAAGCIKRCEQRTKPHTLQPSLTVDPHLASHTQNAIYSTHDTSTTQLYATGMMASHTASQKPTLPASLCLLTSHSHARIDFSLLTRPLPSSLSFRSTSHPHHITPHTTAAPTPSITSKVCRHPTQNIPDLHHPPPAPPPLPPGPRALFSSSRNCK